MGWGWVFSLICPLLVIIMCKHQSPPALSVKSVASLQTVASLKSRVDSASIPAAKKADIRAKISVLQVLQ